MRRLAFVLALIVLATACSKSKTKNVDQPTKLVPFASTLRVERVWTASVGGTKKPLLLGLNLAVEGHKVYAAGWGGEVAAFDVSTGRRIWRRRLKATLAGGPAADPSLVVVGSIDGDVFALRASDGAVVWHADVAGEILAAPAVTPRIVVVRAVDGKLHGLSPVDGHEFWQVQQPVPGLSLRGTSRPDVVGEVAICGFDNGKVVAANLSDGSSVWETEISTPHGSNQIEQLDDVDATPRTEGNDVYVAQFQGKVARLALDTGQIWWSHDMSSYRGMGVDDENVYVSTADGQVIAMRRNTGVELWRQKALMYRDLSSPTVAGDAIVVADYKGYVHWLNKETGALMGRVRSGKRPISNTPVTAGGLLLVVNDDGRVAAFRAIPIAASVRSSRRSKHAKADQ
jgi:outer membrane protein assembly factor BamB